MVQWKQATSLDLDDWRGNMNPAIIWNNDSLVDRRIGASLDFHEFIFKGSIRGISPSA